MTTQAPTLAVTGSTGALGGLVARGLAAQGVEQRLLVRSAGRAPDLAGAHVVEFPGYGDRAAAVAALAGVRTLLMVSGAESAERLEQHRTFVDAAAEAGVGHVVYTSFQGAAPDCTFTLGRDHHATEAHLRASGLTTTFLRDSFYLDFLPDMAGEDGVIRGPAGDGRVAAVARADVARSAVEVLLDPAAHAGATYDLTGPEALTMTEVAETITNATGRTVTFHDETLEEAYASRRRWEAPQWQYDAWVSTYVAMARGEVAAVSGDVARLTGREPTSLAGLLAERAAG
ncbi:SDR family oxidoreductase [Nocardioides alkalitolerans]|uniref:SDR family oxidoreductase n=1 Tax=Nocardioides alkalitolerans TaxID=281714 RepID=UPI0003F700AC|nr:SDR family oxidoreductase [Nocardioides alkalitolerans]